MQRTVGINTGHVDTTDFKMEQADKDFLIEVNLRTTTILHNYIHVMNVIYICSLSFLKKRCTSINNQRLLGSMMFYNN